MILNLHGKWVCKNDAHDKLTFSKLEGLSDIYEIHYELQTEDTHEGTIVPVHVYPELRLMKNNSEEFLGEYFEFLTENEFLINGKKYILLDRNITA